MKNILYHPKTALIASYLLLALLLFQLFFVPIFTPVWHKNLYSFSATAIYLSLAVLITENKVYAFSFITSLLVLEWLLQILDFDILSSITVLFNVIFFIFIITKFIIEIARSKEVDSFVILHAINGYLLIGLICSAIIGLITRLDPVAFSYPEAGIMAEGITRQSEYTYHGMVTLSTLGYGDITPIAPYARSLSTLISVIGQLYLAIIMALLIGKFSNKQN